MTSALRGLLPAGDLTVVQFRSPAELWRERKSNERGTAPFKEPASNADLVCEPVDDGWPGHDESPYKYH